MGTSCNFYFDHTYVDTMADELDMAFMDDLISQVDQKVDTLKRQIKTNGEEKVRRVSFVTFGTFDEEPKIDDVRSISSTSSVGEIREGRNAKKVDRLQRNTTRSKTLTHVRRRKPDARTAADGLDGRHRLDESEEDARQSLSSNATRPRMDEDRQSISAAAQYQTRTRFQL